MINLNPISRKYYEKKINSKLVLKLFKFFQIVSAVLTLVLYLIILGIILGILYLPDRLLKNWGRQGFIIPDRYKGFPSPTFKNIFKKQGYRFW